MNCTVSSEEPELARDPEIEAESRIGDSGVDGELDKYVLMDFAIV